MDRPAGLECSSPRLSRDGLRSLEQSMRARRWRVHALMISTDSGILLHGWQSPESRFDPGILSGMLSAVAELVKDAVPRSNSQPCEEDGNQCITVGRKSVIYRRRGRLTAAALVEGSVDALVVTELDRLLSLADPAYERAAKLGWVPLGTIHAHFLEAVGRLALS